VVVIPYVSVWILDFSDIAHMQLWNEFGLLVWGIVLFCYRLDIRFVVFFKNDWMDFNQ
jgi:hypothetical protein